jgi:hypothetical protein
MTVQDQQAKYEPFLGVSGWYEFLGDNTTNVASGGYDLQATDNVTGAIGEVTGGVDVYSLVGDGISGFVKGNFQFGKDDYVGFGGSFGVRVDWFVCTGEPERGFSWALSGTGVRGVRIRIRNGGGAYEQTLRTASRGAL